MRNISFLVLVTIFLGVCIVNGYDDDGTKNNLIIFN
jgi:hypothetical protein